MINLTWLLEHTQGQVILLSLAWNNSKAVLDEAVLIERAFDALALLRR